MPTQTIPFVTLDMNTHANADNHCQSILENEISDIQLEHVAITHSNTIVDRSEDGVKAIYLFLKGSGDVKANNAYYEIVQETIFLPNAVEEITIRPASNTTLHYLKISCKLSTQDHIDFKNLPEENTQNVYYAKFSDCQSYSEAIKSPNTVSRSILSNKYIPRVAMGTVQTTGPDNVAAHEHPMLEQLFLGLAENNCIVYADDDYIDFPEHSILHIPLGSSHSVSVKKEKTMSYVWMDFFLDKEGEEWLKTHNIDADQNQRGL